MKINPICEEITAKQNISMKKKILLTPLLILLVGLFYSTNEGRTWMKHH